MDTREFLKTSYNILKAWFLIWITPQRSRQLALSLEEKQHELYSHVYAKKLERDRARYDLYINKYRQTAQDEQKHYGIPASISLAQALNETDAWISKIATKVNNHFWIKCKADGPHPHWADASTCSTGCIHHSDDNEDDHFLRYKSIWYSRRWHSKKLKESRYKSGNLIYGHLFDNTKTRCIEDRCRGLSLYSSSSTYPSSLRTLIDFFDLTKYDHPQWKKER